MIPANRLERLLTCGQKAIVQCGVTADGEVVHRVVARRCHDRLCEACMHDRATLIARGVVRKVGSHHLRHLTLTLRSTLELAPQLNELIAAFGRLRRREVWKQAVAGGAFFLEVTYGKSGWHAHLHVLFVGKFLPQRAIADAWRAVTPSHSDNVHVCDVPKTEQGIKYLTTYAAKATNTSVTADPHHLAEFATAMHGRRCTATFGTWRGFELTDTEREERVVKWESLGPVRRVVADALDGDPKARTACKAIGIEPKDYADLLGRTTKRETARSRAKRTKRAPPKRRSRT